MARTYGGRWLGNWIYDSAWFYPTGSHRVSSGLLFQEDLSSVWRCLCWPCWLALLKTLWCFSNRELWNSPNASYIVCPCLWFRTMLTSHQMWDGEHGDLWAHHNFTRQTQSQGCFLMGASLGGRNQPCEQVKLVVLVWIMNPDCNWPWVFLALA